MRSSLVLAMGAVLLTACRTEPTDSPAPAADAPPTASVSTIGDDQLPDSTTLEAQRYPGRSRQSAEVDTLAQAEAARSNREQLADVTRDARRTAAWRDSLHLPLGGDVEGPSVLKLQVLLDRAHFSPGQIDGRWGDNTEAALVAFQQATETGESLGVADSATVRALAERAGSPRQLVTAHVLTEEDVTGPFEPIPDDVYAKAEMDRLGYESLAEKLGERFHASPGLLQRLNDGVDLNGLAAGDTLRAPNVQGAPSLSGSIARLEISGSGHWIHGLAEDGAVLFHAPTTVGAEYDPSPSGSFQITGIARNPDWHYQPAILANVPDDEEDAILPPGPNNAVGTVWMSLSKPHYGIHGTRAPGTIGYASSAGCVRLTNWDVERLAGLVSAGTPVRFRDIAGRSGGSASGGSGSPSGAASGASTP